MPTTIAPKPVVAPDVAPDPRPINPYAKVYADFREETADHVLRVSHDSGLHRQMRVGTPGTGMWSWGVTTWPGYLATFGDIADGFMFTRDIDMLAFFDRPAHLRDYYSDGAPCIDFRYWAQKLSGGRSHDVLVYSEKAFIERVTEALDEDEDLGTDARAEYDKLVEVSKRVCARNNIDYETYLKNLREPGADADVISLTIDPKDDDEVELFGLIIPERSPDQIREEILWNARHHSDDEREAREWLAYDEQVERFGSDTWEWDIRDYDVHFLFACYAIDMTVQLWRQYEKANDAKALDASVQSQSRELITAARERVDAGFKVIGHGEVGEPSNGALLVRLADLLTEQIVARPAYVPQEVPAGESYVLVEGGLVQNTPSIQVFDVDVLSDDSPNADTAGAAADVYLRIYEHPDARTDLEDVLTRLADFVRDHGCTKDIARVEEYEAERLATLAVNSETASVAASSTSA